MRAQYQAEDYSPPPKIKGVSRPPPPSYDYLSGVYGVISIFLAGWRFVFFYHMFPIFMTDNSPVTN